MAATVPLGSPRHAGLPKSLKTGIETLSGVAMDDVRVHRQSSRPAAIGAHAYAQGRDIHLAPGQERHLPHEAWHVVQQKQGRVRADGATDTGTPLNQSPALEREADTMGARASRTSAPVLTSTAERSAAPATHGSSVQAMPIQRKISYKRGRFGNEKQLVDALLNIYPPGQRKNVLAQVKIYEEMKDTLFGSQAFDYIVYNLEQKGIKAKFAITSSASSSRHGPKLPIRSSRLGREDPKDALKTFNFSTVTLARSILADDEVETNFHDRNDTEGQLHAEDGIVDQLETHLDDDEIDPSDQRLNLTINNFFCSHQTTTKTDKSKNCLDKIIRLQRKRKFKNFHVYFKNTYGKPELMTTNIKKLKAVGIKVSSLSTKKGVAPYFNDELDPHSESEDESDTRAKTKRSAKRKSKLKSVSPESSSSEEEQESVKRAKHKKRSSPSSAPSRSSKYESDSSDSSSDESEGEPDVVEFYGHRFSPNTRGIRDGGECFWDTMRHYGIGREALRKAARASGLTVNKAVDVRDLAAFMTELNRDRVRKLYLRVVTFTYEDSEHSDFVDIGEGDKQLYIGLFMQGDQGHYVPEL